MEENTNKKPGRWKRVLLIIALVLLCLILAAVACAAIFVNSIMDQIDYQTEDDYYLSTQEAEDLLATDPELEPIDPGSDESLPNIEDMTFPTEPEKEEEYVKDENVINILLIGQDRQSGDGRSRSDAMILVTFNKNSDEITLTSFMRDSYVQIPGYKPNKLNAAYQYGGMSLLNETLKLNFGVEVDGNAEVDFSRFENLIDLLGGVDIELTQKEADHLNTYDVWNYHKGVNHMDGAQALAYARLRKIDSDYRRAERQRNVVMALIEAYKNKPVTEMVSLLDEILPLLRTNMDKGEILGLLFELAPMLTDAEFDTMRIPADGTFKGGNAQVRPGLKNWFQYDIDFEENRKLLREIFDAE